MEGECQLQELLNSAVAISGKGSINPASLHDLLSQMIEKLSAVQSGQKLATKVPVTVMDWLSKDRKKPAETEAAGAQKPKWMQLIKAASQPNNKDDQPTAKKSPWDSLSKAVTPSTDETTVLDKQDEKDDKAKEPKDSTEAETGKTSLQLTELAERLEKVESLLWRFEGKAEMALPANAVIVKGSDNAEVGEKPLTEMWQAIRLRNKVEANESGINKLVSIYEELNFNIREMEKEMKEKNEHYAQKMEDMISRIGECQELSSSLKEKVNDIDASVNDFSNIVQNGVVTWDTLEGSLHSANKMAADGGRGTAVGGLSRMSGDRSNRASVAGRGEGKEMTVGDVGVAEMSHRLAGSLKELGFVAETYHSLMQQNEALKVSLDEKSEQIGEMDEFKRIIQSLTSQIDTLNKNYDKNQDIIKQMKKNSEKNDLEKGNNYRQMANVLQGKLDRDEMKEMMREIEKKLIMLSKESKSNQELIQQQLQHQKLLQQHLQTERESAMPADGEAAGFRRKYNCISCDRPLEMTSKRPLPSLPVGPKMAGQNQTKLFLPPSEAPIRSVVNHSRVSGDAEMFSSRSQQKKIGSSSTTFRDVYNLENTKYNSKVSKDQQKLPGLNTTSRHVGSDGLLKSGYSRVAQSENFELTSPRESRDSAFSSNSVPV